MSSHSVDVPVQGGSGAAAILAREAPDAQFYVAGEKWGQRRSGPERRGKQMAKRVSSGNPQTIVDLADLSTIARSRATRARSRAAASVAVERRRGGHQSRFASAAGASIDPVDRRDDDAGEIKDVDGRQLKIA